MEFRILGPLEVYDPSGRRLELPTGRERALLVALLLRRGEVVSVDALIDALWGERPPGTAAKAIQGYVSHLRRLMGAGSSDVLVTQPPGYALRVTDEQVDAGRFEQLATEGQRALDDDDPGEALAALESALSLVRGAPLAEFEFDDFAQHEIQRLTELRLAATEDRIEALLRLGRHGGLVADLEALVGAHPLRDRLRGQLMLALYRSGRPADALQAYRDGSRHSRALGLEPAAELKSLERAILDQDPSLAAPARVPSESDRAEQPAPARPDLRSVGHRRFLLAGLAATVFVAAVIAGLLLRDGSNASPLTEVPPNSLAVIDPTTNQLEDYVPVGAEPIAVAVGAGAVWVINVLDGTLSRIDPKTREVTRTIGLGTPAVDVTVAFGSVWVANGTAGTVTRVDPESNAVAETFEIRPDLPLVSPVVSSIAAGAGSIWVTSGVRKVLRLDPDGGNVVATLSVPTEPVAIAYGEGAIWVGTVARRVVRIEPRTNTITAEIPVRSTTIAVAAGAGSVWAAVCCDSVWRIEPESGAVDHTVAIGLAPASVAVEPGAVWASSVVADTVSRIDPATGRIVGKISIGNWPADVAIGFGRVWAVVQAPDQAPG